MSEAQERICARCKERKPRSEFYTYRCTGGIRKPHGKCKLCMKVESASRVARKDKRRAHL